ncbi:TlpA family protein disulfide reductase [Actinomadura sp. 6N118]|uniref:TlpA family protein disulfide reductase n=1 Tax=Actinomadura sp. 6N118 TaxID=3375151 RepID=UPI0037B7E0E2
MRKLTLLLAGTLALAACGGSDDDPKDAATVQPTPSASSPTGAAAGSGTPSGRLRSMPAQLKFEGTTLDGKPFTGSNLAEQPVVFWFWAPWCPKCQSEGPAVAKVAERYKGRVAFVGIAGLDKSKDQMQKFVSRTGTGSITQLDDREGDLYKHFKVTSQSSFLFMKRDGSSDRASGPLGEDDLEKHVKALVGG